MVPFFFMALASSFGWKAESEGSPHPSFQSEPTWLPRSILIVGDASFVLVGKRLKKWKRSQQGAFGWCKRQLKTSVLATGIPFEVCGSNCALLFSTRELFSLSNPCYWWPARHVFQPGTSGMRWDQNASAKVSTALKCASAELTLCHWCCYRGHDIGP